MAAVWPGSVHRVTERSLLSMAAMVMYFAALPATGIAQAAAGLFTSPIWVVLISALSVIWTRRHCRGESAICLAVWQFAALFLAGLAGLVLAPWFGPMLAGVEGVEFVTQPLQGVGWEMLLVLFLIGMARIIAAGCLVTGYQAGDASVMGLFDFSFLFWAPFFAWLLWGDVVSPWMAAGMGLIVIAGALAMWSGARGHGRHGRSDR
jgi:drug/metabolite transporter (DMT)-like permease